MKPCPHALSLARVPSKRWDTRVDVHTRIEAVRQAMDERPGHATLADLAQAANLSPFHFHRVFKATYGKTPATYLLAARLNRAHLLLSLGQMNATDACFEVGFASQSSFSRAFRARFGYPPGQTPRKWTANSKIGQTISPSSGR